MLAERALLRGLGGGCLVPLGASAHIEGSELFLRGAVLSPDGRQRIAAEHRGGATEAEVVGQQLAEMLLASDARALLISPG